MNRITALIPAYNAEKTIARAIASCCDQVDEVLVVNDGSTDQTSTVVQQYRTDKLRIIDLEHNVGIGRVRQIALEHCNTEFAAWLDADDTFLPNRIKTLLPWLHKGYHLVYDNLELFDGLSQSFLRISEIPDFLKNPTGLCIQFARNHIRGIGIPLINVESARKVGYNDYRHAEDFDFFLRALLQDCKIKLHDSVSYRQYTFPSSLSNSTTDREEYQRQILSAIGLNPLQNYLSRKRTSASLYRRICLFYLANIRDWNELLRSCQNLIDDKDKEERWLALYMSGVAFLHSQQYQSAQQAFQAAADLEERAEVFNNLAVCGYYLSQNYLPLLHKALQLKPDYLDASNNLNSPVRHITNVPLRNRYL